MPREEAIGQASVLRMSVHADPEGKKEPLTLAIMRQPCMLRGITSQWMTSPSTTPPTFVHAVSVAGLLWSLVW